MKPRMKSALSRHRIHMGWAAALVMTGFMSSTPAQAMPPDITACKPALTDIRVTNTNLKAVINDLDALKSDISKVESYLQIPLDMRNDIRKLDTTMKDIDEVLSILADLSDPVPEIAEPLNDISTAMQGVQEGVLDPMNTIITDAVNILHIEQMKKELDNGKKHIDDVKAPFVDVQGDVSDVVDATQKMVTVVSALPQGRCRKPIAQSVNAYCTGLDDVARPIAQAENTVSQTALNAAQTIQHDVEAIFKPFDVIKRDLQRVTNSIDAIYHELKVMEHDLARHIHLKIAGVTVATFSVKEILDDWNRVVNIVKHFIGLDKAEKWLRKEVEHIMHRPIKSIERTIKHMVKSVKIDGMNLNDAKHLLDRVKGEIATMKSDIANAKADMRRELKKAQDYARSTCK